MKSLINNLQKVCKILELVAAVLVLIGIVLAIVGLFWSDIKVFEELLHDTTAFRHFLEKIFDIVIGIEFLEMLCHANTDNVIHVLIFLVARHMIVGDTTPYEDLVSVLSISILIVLRNYMHGGVKKPAPPETDS